HALAGDDPAQAAALIELAAPDMQRARQESRLRSWLEALPHEVFPDRPVLAMALDGARMATGDAVRQEPLLDGIDRWLGRVDGVDREESPIVVAEVTHARLPATAAVQRAGLALLAGDLDATIGHANRVLDLAGDDAVLQRGAAAALV